MTKLCYNFKALFLFSRCEYVDVDYTVKPVVITTRKDLYTNIWSLLVEEIIGLGKQIVTGSI